MREIVIDTETTGLDSLNGDRSTVAHCQYVCYERALVGRDLGMLSVEEVTRLTEYWLRAELMQEHLYEMDKVYKGDIDAMRKDGVLWRYDTYLGFWLASLFVVVEGFRKLKLRDKEVLRLFNSHVSELKLFRHDTYHFTLIGKLKGVSVINQLNWVDDLHDAIGRCLSGTLNRALNKQKAQEILELRRKKVRRVRNKKRSGTIKGRRAS
jgi:hypothetical protein